MTSLCENSTQSAFKQLISECRRPEKQTRSQQLSLQSPGGSGASGCDNNVVQANKTAGTFLTSTAPSVPRFRRTLLQRVQQYIAYRKQRRTRRDAFQVLHSLDDEILDDIGITRGDVMWASQLPLNCDAASELEKRRHRTRPG